MGELYATSTVAISVYNLLTITGDAITLKEIHRRLESQQHPGLDIDQLSAAVIELVHCKLLQADGDKYCGIDLKRRTIAVRDRSDGAINPETGECEGGWHGWMVRDPQRGFVPIEETVRAVRTTQETSK
ncbi:MAG: hypothetical protein GY854_02180 [Deltaproteobacteria bacterium]|nr:hypothetical protein [Deltaproteobacteria bacterium]